MALLVVRRAARLRTSSLLSRDSARSTVSSQKAVRVSIGLAVCERQVLWLTDEVVRQGIQAHAGPVQQGRKILASWQASIAPALIL